MVNIAAAAARMWHALRPPFEVPPVTEINDGKYAYEWDTEADTYVMARPNWAHSESWRGVDVRDVKMPTNWCALGVYIPGDNPFVMYENYDDETKARRELAHYIQMLKTYGIIDKKIMWGYE